MKLDATEILRGAAQALSGIATAAPGISSIVVDNALVVEVGIPVSPTAKIKAVNMKKNLCDKRILYLGFRSPPEAKP
jgi:hypothetical protein